MSETNAIRLSDHFNYQRLLKFAIAPICTMLFTSLYGIVDGYFVSNYVGATGFAALNLVMPFLIITSSVGFMFGSGGSALVSKQLGEEKTQTAKESFTLLVIVTSVCAVLLSLLGLRLNTKICLLLGANEAMLPYCRTYLRINMYGLLFFMLQNLFQSFLICAEKPKLGFVVTVAAGCTNMVLDFVLVGVCRLGIAGAAWATILAQVVGGGLPLLYFFGRRKGILYFVRPHFRMSVIAKSAGNGVSEFLSNISASIVGFLLNLQLLKYAGEHGVAAYGVIMYLTFIFAAIYIGFCMSIAPVIGFHYGAKNKSELHNLLKKSMVILLVGNVAMVVSAFLFARPMVHLFVGYDADLYELTLSGMRIYAPSFLVMGFNFFFSAFFTALNNGTVSAIISVMRSLVLQLVMIYTLPIYFGVNGLWGAVIAVEAISFLIGGSFVLGFGKKYGYLSGQC